MHIREHLGEKPHKCDFCPYSSARKSNLKLHLKKHVKDPDLLPINISNVKICEYCNVTYQSNRSLMEHWENCQLVPMSSKKNLSLLQKICTIGD